MGKGNQLNTLLVEIMIAVFLFACSSTVVLRTFVVTRNQSREAGIYDTALMEAQNIADRLYASADYEVVLEQAGFTRDEQGWTLAQEDYDLRVTTAQETTSAGVLLRAEVIALHRDEALLTLPCVRYLPGEVQP